MSVETNRCMVTLVYTCDICEAKELITTRSNERALPDGWEKNLEEMELKHICNHCVMIREFTNERLLNILISALHLTGYSEKERKSFFVELQKRCNKTSDFFTK